MEPWKMAIIIFAIIGIIYLILLAVAGFGTAESSAGHYLGSTLKGTPLEQPATSIGVAGDSLTQSADGTIAEFTALLIIGAIFVAVALDS